MARVSTDLDAIKGALKIYALENNSFPTSDQGIEKLYSEKYIYGSNADPWGREYIYSISEPDETIEISSLGRDGKIGGKWRDSDMTVSIHTQKFLQGIEQRNRRNAEKAERVRIEAENDARLRLERQIMRIPNDLDFIRDFVEFYRLELGKYPTTMQSIEVFLKTKFVTPGDTGIRTQEWILKDPWGRHYLYQFESAHNQIEIYTLGADGVIGGHGPNKDIHHRKKSELPHSQNQLTLLLKSNSNLKDKDISMRDYYFQVLVEKLFYR